MKVEKRDGRQQTFDFSKIISVIDRVYADKDVASPVPEGLVDSLSKHFDKMQQQNINRVINIETIQDTIRDFLMKKNQYKAAESFILYRKKREQIRESKTSLHKSIVKKLQAQSLDNSNANVDEASFGGRMGEVANAVTSDFALKNCMSKMSRDNHLNNEIYIHDLSSYALGSHNCLSIPFDDLLANGFTTRQTDVRPARSVSTASQLIAVIFQLQSLQQFGGVSATHIDWTMVPYVRMSFYKHYIDGLKYVHHMNDDITSLSISDSMSITDDVYKSLDDVYTYALDMTEKEIEQSVEGLYHNLNTLQSRSGNQLPFTSLNYGTCTLEEGRIYTRALLEMSLKGNGKHGRTSIFPCGIFQYMKGVNDAEGTPNYDLFKLAVQSTAKRLYPNYANVDWSGNAGYDVNDPRTYFSTMGCRTANSFDINGLGQLKDGRGNICPVTIIMPTLAMQSSSVESFITLLDKKISEAKDMLIERFEYICSQSPASAKFMYDNHTMAGYVPEEGIRSALKHGTLAIGQLGLAETLHILIGCDHTTEDGMTLAKKIEQLFKTRCAEFKKQYSLNFGVYYTPAESLCYTAFKRFKNMYGDIEGVTYYTDSEGVRHDKDYFTNSMHVPVYKQMSPFDKIDIESQLTGYSSAGCITYVEVLHDAVHNTAALETLIHYAMKKDIPYFAVNSSNDICEQCGYQGSIVDVCPKCGSSQVSRLKRVTGYLTGDYKTAFNQGKQTEVSQRVVHNKSIQL